MQAARRVIRQVTQVNYCRRLAIRNQSLPIPVTAIIPQSCRSCSSAAPASPPAVDGAPKDFAPKIQQLVDEISRLNLLEVADLNELLKKTLNIQDTPMMAMGAMPAAGANAEEEEEEAPKREKTSFTVKLIKFDSGKKVQLIKEIKQQVEGLNLVQSKKFVEAIPQVVKADVTKEEAEKLKEALVAAGAEVEIE